MSDQGNEIAPGCAILSSRVALSRGPRNMLRPHYQAVQSLRAPAVTFFTSFAEAESHWRIFEANAIGTAFQSYDWLAAWHRHVGAAAGVRPLIVFVALSGKPLMLAPLGLEWHLGLRRVIWLGGRLADYKAPLLTPDFDWRVTPGTFPTLWAEIIRALPAHDLVMLENQPAHLGDILNPFMELASSPAPDNGYVFVLPRSYDELAAQYRSQTRRSDRAKERHLTMQGILRFHIASSAQEAGDMVQEILERKATQLRAQGIASIFEEEVYRAAYAELAALPFERRLLEVAVLTLNGEMLSGSISHVWKGRTTLMVHVYNRRFAKLSPGRLHLLQLIKSSIEAGRQLFDLSIGQAAYKEKFVDEPLPLFNHVAAASLWGVPVARATRAWLGLRRVVKNSARLMAFFQRIRAKIAKY